MDIEFAQILTLKELNVLTDSGGPKTLSPYNHSISNFLFCLEKGKTTSEVFQCG